MTVVAAGLSATKSDVGQEQQSKKNPGPQCVLQGDPGRSASDKLCRFSGPQCVLQGDPGRSASDKLCRFSLDRQPFQFGDPG